MSDRKGFACKMPVAHIYVRRLGYRRFRWGPQECGYGEPQHSKNGQRKCFLYGLYKYRLYENDLYEYDLYEFAER